VSHFARIDENNIVTEVIVWSDDLSYLPSNKYGGNWIQTSYNTKGGIHYSADNNTPSENQEKALRKNFAGIGYYYDKDRDAFIAPQPFNSWLLNEETCIWEAPIPFPKTGLKYNWNENNEDWDEVE
jgi:hypothetical protein